MNVKDVSDLMDETKELKVKIPSEHHVKLQSLKILAGKNISTAVTEAIAMYLEERGEAPPELEDNAGSSRNGTNGSNGSHPAEA